MLLVGCGLADGSSKSSADGRGAGSTSTDGAAGTRPTGGAAGFGGRGVGEGGTSSIAGASSGGGGSAHSSGGASSGGLAGTGGAARDCDIVGEAFTVTTIDSLGVGALHTDGTHLYWQEVGPCLEWSGQICVGSYPTEVVRSDPCGSGTELFTPSRAMHPTVLSSDSNYVYWLAPSGAQNRYSLWAQRKDSTARFQIADDVSSGFSVWQGSAYWIAEAAGEQVIRQRPVDLSSEPTDQAVAADGLAVSDAGIFTHSSSRIRRHSHTWQQTGDISDGGGFFDSLAVAPGHVFWRSNLALLSTGDTLTQSVTVVADNVIRFAPAADGRVFWTTSRDEVLSSSWSGTDVQLISDGGVLGDIAASTSYVFWVHADFSDGGGGTTIRGMRRN